MSLALLIVCSSQPIPLPLFSFSLLRCCQRTTTQLHWLSCPKPLIVQRFEAPPLLPTKPHFQPSTLVIHPSSLITTRYFNKSADLWILFVALPHPISRRLWWVLSDESTAVG
ncbi:uncharacterized protein LAJ45_01615 [Morchella importuna]|uniref:uncharacterized protein n=1 Tax=Morchella importuna TaxID=1174673 RepID=UPI001E8E05EB|nr:uncharacterized protein LAJ45_01615 [Morchella importuna]KAH8153848.1 hypothetical protein LAJ45_01615 [Morchella importuna]